MRQRHVNDVQVVRHVRTHGPTSVRVEESDDARVVPVHDGARVGRQRRVSVGQRLGPSKALRLELANHSPLVPVHPRGAAVRASRAQQKARAALQHQGDDVPHVQHARGLVGPPAGLYVRSVHANLVRRDAHQVPVRERQPRRPVSQLDRRRRVLPRHAPDDHGVRIRLAHGRLGVAPLLRISDGLSDKHAASAAAPRERRPVGGPRQTKDAAKPVGERALTAARRVPPRPVAQVRALERSDGEHVPARRPRARRRRVIHRGRRVQHSAERVPDAVPAVLASGHDDVAPRGPVHREHRAVVRLPPYRLAPAGVRGFHVQVFAATRGDGVARGRPRDGVDGVLELLEHRA